jgi:hypothetical protein
MGQGEFYSSNEYNAVSEYKHFPAETYQKPWEENKCGKEEADLGRETTSLQPRAKKLKRSGEAQTLIDKLFGSVRGVATAATVAAASTVVVTTLVTSAPQAELITYECGDTYITYEMQVGGLEEDGDYAIVLSTTNEEDRELGLEGDGVYRDRIEGLKPEWEYRLSLVEYDSILGEIRHFEIKLQTVKHSEQEPIPPPAPDPVPLPSVTVTGAQIVGINKVRLYFTPSDVPDAGTVELDVLFGDASTARLVLAGEDIAKGYAELTMGSSATLTVTPTVVADSNGEMLRTVCEAYTHTFAQTFAVETMVGLYDGAVTFYPIGITCGAEYVSVTSSEAPGTAELVWLEDVIRLWYTTEDVITYSMHLSDDTGAVLSNTVTVTVDTSIVPPSTGYHMQTPNPGDVCITYNDDGTVNLYIQTKFESERAELYYQISLDSIRYVSRDPLARIEHIPDQSYALQYDVCMDINGVQYSIFSVSPSGMVNEAYFYLEYILENNALSLQIYKEAMHADMNSVRLVSSGGEEILLTEADFVYNDMSGSYDYEVEFSKQTDAVVISMMANPYYEGLESIDSYIGNTRKLWEVTAYQP